MAAPESFILRWARLKRGSEPAPSTKPMENGRQPKAVAPAGAETPSARQRDEVIDEPFDPASLPSIETINVDTDIRGFLQSHVPAALTRAALRQAWVSDPAIRDSIGIAENQWDFNDPAAMPGFGPMRETDNLPALLARAIGGPDKLTDIISETAVPVENVLPTARDRESADPDPRPRQSSDGSISANEICNVADDSAAAQNDRVIADDDSSRSYRSHGGALPR